MLFFLNESTVVVAALAPSPSPSPLPPREGSHVQPLRFFMSYQSLARRGRDGSVPGGHRGDPKEVVQGVDPERGTGGRSTRGFGGEGTIELYT